MKVVGQIPLCRYPIWRKSVESLLPYVDELYVRFDGIIGNTNILLELPGVCGPKLKQVIVSYQPYSPQHSREEMVRALDIVRPDIVISIDSDEAVESGFGKDLEAFVASGYTQMQMNHRVPMPTADGVGHVWPHSPNGAFPGSPHVKAYKWREGLSYTPYCGYCKVTQYNGDPVMTAESQLQHYAFWDADMMAVHIKDVDGKVAFAADAAKAVADRPTA